MLYARDVGAPPAISVVLPVFNEQDNIARAVTSAAAVLSELASSWEIVAVDDASTDATPQLLRELGARYPGLRVITLQRNTKFAGALIRGLRQARGEAVFYTDSDNPIDFAELKRALPLLQHDDVVVGYRANRDEGLRRALYSRGYNVLVRSLTGLRVRDVNFSFKLFKAAVLRDLRPTATGSFIDAELLLEARAAGYTVVEIPVAYHERVAGESTLASVPIAWKCFRELVAWRVRRGS